MTTEERLTHLEELARELIAQNRRMADHIQKLQHKLSEANHRQREQEELADETEALIFLEQAKQALLRLADKRKQQRLKKRQPEHLEIEEFPKWIGEQE